MAVGACRQTARAWAAQPARRPVVPAAASTARAAAAGRPRWRLAARADAGGGGASSGSEQLGPLSQLGKPKNQLAPSYFMSREETVEAQLKALSRNNEPHIDHGIETLYRFTGFDPFSRSAYFGVTLDLGQFERFRRILYTPYYFTLLNCTDWEFLSTLEVAEDAWVARVKVINAYRKEERVYEFRLRQRLGGHRDGCWYTDQLLAEGCTEQTLYGVI